MLDRYVLLAASNEAGTPAGSAAAVETVLRALEASRPDLIRALEQPRPFGTAPRR